MKSEVANMLDHTDKSFVFSPIDFFLLIGIIILVLKRKQIFQSAVNVLNPVYATKIRGLLAVLIIIHHLSITIVSTSIFKVFSSIGIVSVAIFFFYSGYGLMCSYCQKKDYLQGFAKKRLLKIAIPYIISIGVTWLGHLLTKYKFTLKEIWNSLFDGNPIVTYSWYVLAIIVLYIVFYLSGKVLKKPRRILIGIFVGILVYIYAVTHLASWGNWTINSCFSFLFGCVFATYNDKINTILVPNKKHIITAALLLGIAGSIVGIQFLISDIPLMSPILPEFFDEMLKRPLSTISINLICFVMIIVSFWVLARIKLNDRVFSFLGKISFEIYLYHGFVMYMLKNSIWLCKPDLIYAFLVVTLSIIMAYVMNRINDYLLMKRWSDNNRDNDRCGRSGH